MWRARGLMILCVWAMTTTVFAQVPAPPSVWGRGSDLGLFAGGAASSTVTGATVAGSFDWEVSRWNAIEARASWFDRGEGAKAFGFDVSGLVNLITKRSVTPFVGGGYGVYHASFASPSSEMSEFYRSRIEPALVTEAFSFTDPALRLTGGVDIIAKRSISLRPEASLLVVFNEDRTERLITFGFRLAYRFEDHPITP